MDELDVARARILYLESEVALLRVAIQRDLEEVNLGWAAYMRDLLGKEHCYPNPGGIKWTGWKMGQRCEIVVGQVCQMVGDGMLAYASYPGASGIVPLGSDFDITAKEGQRPFNDDLDLRVGGRARDPETMRLVADDLIGRLRATIAASE